MKAVFLDSATFSSDVDLHTPRALTNYQNFTETQQDDALIIKRCHDAEIIITNKVQFSRTILSQLPCLKLIQLTATGMNNIDLEACGELGVQVNNVAGYAVKSVPEHTFMLMLSAMRACNHYHQAVVGTAWKNVNKFCLIDEPLIDLEGKTLGIIGAGTIGRRVAEIANVFGMRVLFAERKNQPPRNVEYTAFEQVMAMADIMSLHCPLTEATKHLINADSIALMQRKPLIVNVARGGVVDSQAIATAIDNGDIFGYASDVFEAEPMTDNDPLYRFTHHPRVVYSPHNAWGSLSAQQELWDSASRKVNEFIEG